MRQAFSTGRRPAREIMAAVAGDHERRTGGLLFRLHLRDGARQRRRKYRSDAPARRARVRRRSYPSKNPPPRGLQRTEKIVLLDRSWTMRSSTPRAWSTATSCASSGPELEVATSGGARCSPAAPPRKPVDKGGGGHPHLDRRGTRQCPTRHRTPNLRGNGSAPGYGWADREDKLEALREAWFAAPDLAAQKNHRGPVSRKRTIAASYIPPSASSTADGLSQQPHGM